MKTMSNSRESWEETEKVIKFETLPEYERQTSEFLAKGIKAQNSLLRSIDVYQRAA